MAEDSFLFERFHMTRLMPSSSMVASHVSADASSMAPLPLASQMPNSVTKTGSPAWTADTMRERRSSRCVAA